MPISDAAQPLPARIGRVASGAYLPPAVKLNDGWLTSTYYAGKICLARVTVERPLTISALSIAVFTAVAAKSVRLGLYADVAGYPGGLLFDAGTASISTTGVKDIALSTTLAPGAYWLALLTDATATAVLWGTGGGDDIGVPDAFGAMVGGYAGAQAYGALPAVLPALTAATRGPGVHLKAA